MEQTERQKEYAEEVAVYNEKLKLKAMFNTTGWKIFEKWLLDSADTMLMAIKNNFGESCQRAIGARTAVDTLRNFVDEAKTAKVPVAPEDAPKEPDVLGPGIDDNKETDL